MRRVGRRSPGAVHRFLAQRRIERRTFRRYACLADGYFRDDFGNRRRNPAGGLRGRQPGYFAVIAPQPGGPNRNGLPYGGWLSRVAREELGISAPGRQGGTGLVFGGAANKACQRAEVTIRP